MINLYFIWVTIWCFLFQAGTQLQSKLALDAQANKMSDIFLRGFSNNNVAANDVELRKNMASLSGSGRDVSNNVCRGSNSAFSTFTSLGMNTGQVQVTRPRMRICFDPETEIPRLQKWFSENNHPTRQQVGAYKHYPEPKKLLQEIINKSKVTINQLGNLLVVTICTHFG